jgi:drug/metabolite transporter (DMT)-like permease
MIGAMAPSARGHLAMLLFSLLIAGSFSFGTRIANLMDPIALMALRFAFSGILVGALAWAGTGIRRSHLVAPWRYLALGGLFAAYFVFMFEGLRTAAPVSASAVFTLVPIMTAFFGYLLLGQRINGRILLALLVGASGAIWVIFDGQVSALLRFQIGRGEAVYFVGCVAHAIYSPMARKLNRGEPNVVYTFGMILAGFAILLSLGLPELRSADWSGFPAIFWIGLGYLAVFSSSVTFLLLNFASMNLPSSKVMAYSYLTPSWVVVLELFLTGTVPHFAILAGILATVASVMILLRD